MLVITDKIIFIKFYRATHCLFGDASDGSTVLVITYSITLDIPIVRIGDAKDKLVKTDSYI